MKKLLVLSLFAVAAASQATIILDTLTNPSTGGNYTTGYSGGGSGQHRNLSGDIFAVSAASTAWNITKLEFVTRNSLGGGNQTNVTLDLRFSYFRDGSAASQPFDSFSPSYSDTAWSISGITAGGNYLTTVNFSTPFKVYSAFILGIQFHFKTNGQENEQLCASFRDYGSAANGGATVGTAYNGIFEDLNGNGMLEYSPGASTPVNEYTGFQGVTSASMALRVTADAVPEPASVAVLGLGALALIRRRK